MNDTLLQRREGRRATLDTGLPPLLSPPLAAAIMDDALLASCARVPPSAGAAPSYEQNQPYPEPLDKAARSCGSFSGSQRSRRRQYLSIAMAGISVLMMGGLCFGFDSLYPVLYASGTFERACTKPERTACAARRAALQREKCCVNQESLFVALASASLLGADGVMVVYGELMDRLGPRWCMAVASSLLWTGLSAAAVASATSSDALWAVAFPLLGVSGPGVFMAVLSFGETYPLLEPIVTPLAASMFDGSANVFLLWKLFFFSNLHTTVTTLALVWICLTILIGM